jgi:hypothetical protein
VNVRNCVARRREGYLIVVVVIVMFGRPTFDFRLPLTLSGNPINAR